MLFKGKDPLLLMTLHALNRWAELHFAQSVRQLKVQFVRYDQKGVETVSNNMCVCVMLQRCELK